MAKKSAPVSNENSASEEAPKSLAVRTGVSHVKAIKNNLFKDLEIGGSVIVAGVIRSLSDKEGQYGSFTEFKGDFGCVHGEAVYRGTKLFLPSVAADVLKNQYLQVLEQSADADKTKLKVEFKIQLEKVDDSENKKNQSGFQWSFKNLNETAPERDPVLALLG